MKPTKRLGKSSLDHQLEKAYQEITGHAVAHSLSGQQYLKEIRHYFTGIIDKIPCMVYWKNRQLQYMGCNKLVADFFGFKKNSQIVGKTDLDLFTDQALAKIYRSVDRKIFSEGKPILNQPGELLNDFGERTYTLVSKVPIKNEGGEVVGVVGITLDVTKEKQAEIAKTNFMSNMEHDLRTPFSGIGGVADLLYSYSDKYPELKEFLGIMTKSCTQWQEIHNRIFDALDLQQTIKIESFFVQDEMVKMKDLMGAAVKMKGITLELSYPDRDKTGPVETDLLKFKLILSSLVGNAINFTEKGGVTLQLEKRTNDFILHVIDTGIGIPRDKLDYIFEKFTKLSRSNTYGEKFKGMGLGLYNARRDAEQIQASISVKSESGKGSIFTVCLPTKIQYT